LEKTDEEIIEPESFEEYPEVTTTNAPVPVAYAEDESPTKLKKRGVMSVKYRMLAEMVARSYPINVIAQELHMKETTVYRILEKNEEVWDVINDVINSIFAEGDRLLASLRTKALIKLDEQLNSTDEGVRDKAIDKILKITDYKKEGGDRTAIFIGAGGKSQQGIESVDEMILRMRKERGLPMPKLPPEEK
jgi:hypothetical protein